MPGSGLARADERVVVFVSRGGTCRDPMAKAIAQVALRRCSPAFDLRLEAGALGPPSKGEASHAARRAIERMFGEDLLAGHRPATLTQGVIEEADLILVMSGSMRQSELLPPEKTFVLKEFFGSAGDVGDPWPDGDDAETNARYYRCAEELRAAIEPNIGKLVDFVAATR